MASSTRSIIIFIVLLLSIDNVYALTSGDITQTSQDGYSSLDNEPDTYIGQTFTIPNAPTSISSINVYLYRNGNPGDITLELWRTSGGLPTGSPIASKTLSQGYVSTTSYTAVDFELAYTGVNGDPANTQYAFTIKAPAATLTDYYRMHDYNSDILSGGDEIDYDGNWHSYSSEARFFLYYYYNRQIYSPANPGHLTPSPDGATGVSLTPTFTFNTMSDIDGDTPMYYYVSVSNGGGCEVQGSGSCVYTGPALAYSTTYQWQTAGEDNYCYSFGFNCNALSWSSAWSFTTLDPPDTTPPASVTSLYMYNRTISTLNFTWTKPADADFNSVMVYKNGVFQTNVSNTTNNYKFTGLTANTAYTISTHTKDNIGNINSTWVNTTSTTLADCATDTVCQLENSGIFMLTSSTLYAQSALFTTKVPYDAIVEIELIAMNFTKVGNPGNITLSIYGTNATLYPNSTPVPGCTVTYPASSVTTSWASHGISIPTDCIINDGSYIYYGTPDTFAFSLSATGLDGSNYYAFKSEDTRTYSEGYVYFDSGSGWYRSLSIGNLAFEILYHPDRRPTVGSLSSPTNNQDGVSTNPTYSWTAGSDADSDTVQYDATNCAGFTTSLSCTGNVLNTYTNYSWDVFSFDGWLLSAATTATWNFRTRKVLSISGLSASTVSSDSINWTWTNPTDIDFNSVMVYKNGTFLENVSTNYYVFSGLYSETFYTISTHTKNNAGSVNDTWVNLTQKTSGACATDTVCQLLNTGTFSWTDSSQIWAQTELFTTPFPYDAIVELELMYLNISKTGNPGDITLQYYMTDSFLEPDIASPTGYPGLCKVTIDKTTINGTPSGKGISLPTQCTGSDSFPYINFGYPRTLSFWLNASGLDGSNYYTFAASPSKTYADGYIYKYNTGTLGWDNLTELSLPDKDLYFEIFYHPNRRPNGVTKINPPNNTDNVSLSVTLNWTVTTDPDGDTVTYQTNLGACSLSTLLNCTVNGLHTSTNYSWYVYTYDGWQIGGGNDTWNFRTRPPFNDSYIKWNGSDSNSGESWITAWRYIGYGINASVDWEYTIIHIAPGNYSNDPDINMSNNRTYMCDNSGPAQNASEIWCDMPDAI